MVASAFAVVALALGGLIYAYSGPEKQIQAASNLPSLIDVAPGQPLAIGEPSFEQVRRARSRARFVTDGA